MTILDACFVRAIPAAPGTLANGGQYVFPTMVLFLSGDHTATARVGIGTQDWVAQHGSDLNDVEARRHFSHFDAILALGQLEYAYYSFSTLHAVP